MTFIRRLLCRIGWHSDIRPTSYDGASVHAVCGHCLKRGMIDSQGNLF